MDKKELSKRGFTVIESIWFIPFLLNTLLWVGIFSLFILLYSYREGSYLQLFQSETWVIVLIFLILLFLLPVLYGWVEYIFSGKLFFTENGIIWFWKELELKDIIEKKKRVLIFFHQFSIFWNILWLDLKWDDRLIYKIIAVFLSILICWYMSTLSFYYPLTIWVFLLVSYTLRRWMTIFSLYRFAEIWDKIQLLTPEIEKQSRFIQKNFKTNQNFQILRNWFDSLSSTFSKIVSLVIRLERVEKRANKWNLFDSEKYINSLRSDIIEPLKSLRAFLEEQRQKLIGSQRELTRVRAWGIDPSLRSEWQLTWKRSESLILELGESIEKLDVMIGKMG